MQYEGIILKGIGGFYYVETTEGVFECKAKGRFRKERITPLAGDRVTITVREDKENTIDEIFERKNFLRRPPVANIDYLAIVVSATEPTPNTLIIDKLTTVAEKNHIEPIIIFSKSDLANIDDLIEIYSKTGYKVFVNTDVDKIKSVLNGKLTAFTGNSGVGKSTLLNNLSPGLNLATNEISDKLGRGKHTTRQAEIFHIGDGLVIDTAGFSSLEILENDVIFKADLELYFPEFEEYLGQCKFSTCSHTTDKGCKIIEMVENGTISPSRHKSYVMMYNEAKNIKEWQY